MRKMKLETEFNNYLGEQLSKYREMDDFKKIDNLTSANSTWPEVIKSQNALAKYEMLVEISAKFIELQFKIEKA